MRLAVVLALVGLAACTASPEQVAARCERDARAASTTAVSGEFALGYASDFGSDRGRFVADSDLAISAGVNLPAPRDPRFAYEECVRERTGQGPVRPFGAG